MPRHNGERVGWGHVAAAAFGLVVTNLLLRLGLRRPDENVPPVPRPPALFDDEYDEPRVVDHTPVPPEPRDARVRPVLLALAGLAVFVGFVFAVVTGVQWLQTGRLPSLLPPAGGLYDAPLVPAPPEPRLDVLPEESLAALRAYEAELLNNYAWVDQGAGTVRLPIARAMELLAQRGVPLAPGAEGRTYRDMVPAWPSDASSGRESERLWP